MVHPYSLSTKQLSDPEGPVRVRSPRAEPWTTFSDTVFPDDIQTLVSTFGSTWIPFNG